MKKLKIITGLLSLFFFSCNMTPDKNIDPQVIMQKGSVLFAKYGCAVCHSLDGKVIYGPPLNEIYMKNVTVWRNGKEITLVANRDYLKKAITDPRSEKVLEFKNKEMPIAIFPDEDAELLVDYLILLNEKEKTVK